MTDCRTSAPSGCFGGFGLYSGDLFFGIVHQDILYFKVNGQSRNDYVRVGMAAFKPYKDRPMKMQYYQVPATVVEDADELCEWRTERSRQRRIRRSALLPRGGQSAR